MINPHIMKKIIFLLFLSFFSLSYAQEQIKHPIYPGCQKFKTNEELSKCFSERLWYELNDQTQDDSEDFFRNNKLDHDLILYFTVTKEGKIKNYSYSADSDPMISTAYLKRINRLFNYYEKNGKKIKPATKDNKPADFKIIFKVKYRGH